MGKNWKLYYRWREIIQGQRRSHTPRKFNHFASNAFELATFQWNNVGFFVARLPIRTHIRNYVECRVRARERLIKGK